MDINFYAHVEQVLNNFGDRITALEEALTQLPDVQMQTEPSRLPGVVVIPEPNAPAPAPVNEEPANG